MKYSASPSILETNDLGQLAWDAIEPIWDDLPWHRSITTLKEFMNTLTEGQRGLIALDWCQKEIRNGGFAQLFANDTGNLVPWGIDGFRLIGAKKYATILSTVASMLNSVYPESRDARIRVLEQLGDAQWAEMGQLQLDFYDLLHSEEDDLEEYRGTFVQQHPEQFARSDG